MSIPFHDFRSLVQGHVMSRRAPSEDYGQRLLRLTQILRKEGDGFHESQEGEVKAVSYYSQRLVSFAPVRPGQPIRARFLYPQNPEIQPTLPAFQEAPRGGTIDSDGAHPGYSPPRSPTPSYALVLSMSPDLIYSRMVDNHSAPNATPNPLSD